MARITDPSKIENIKRATMDLIVEKGYGGASISSIAKKAGVSAGYLYRHYSSKEDLVDELVHTNFSRFFNMISSIKVEQVTVSEITNSLISELFNMCLVKPISAKFLCTLMFSFSSVENKGVESEKKLEELITKILEIGKRTNEINPKTTRDELFCVLFSIPFTYMSNNLHKKNNKKYFSDEKAKRISEICINALK